MRGKIHLLWLELLQAAVTEENFRTMSMEVQAENNNCFLFFDPVNTTCPLMTGIHKKTCFFFFLHWWVISVQWIELPSLSDPPWHASYLFHLWPSGLLVSSGLTAAQRVALATKVCPRHTRRWWWGFVPNENSSVGRSCKLSSWAAVVGVETSPTTGGMWGV